MGLEIEAIYEKGVLKLPRELPLVIYCDSEVCPRGALAAALAVEWGYEQVFYFREGYFAWQL